MCTLLLCIIVVFIITQLFVLSQSSDDNYSHRYFTYTEDFAGEVTADGIVYTSVRIPSQAYMINITIWSMERQLAKGSTIYALLRYDGVPTPDHYDAKYEMYKVPLNVGLIDDRPTAGTLYIGIWGGELLHSYRFFAGSPVATPVGVHTIVSKCASSAWSPPLCKPVLSIPTVDILDGTLGDVSTSSMLASLSYSAGLSQPSIYSLLIPSQVQTTKLQITWFNAKDNTAMAEFCRLNIHSLQLQVEAFLDQPLEDQNYISHIYQLSLSESCPLDKSSNIAQRQVALELEYPLPGTWKVRVQLKPSAVNIMGYFPIHILGIMQMIPNDISLSTLQISRGDASSVGYLHFSSSLIPFSGVPISNSSSLKLGLGVAPPQSSWYKMNFLAYLDSQRNKIMLGGALEVQLKLRIPKTLMLENKDFSTLVLLRVGNIPTESTPYVSSAQQIDSGNHSLLSFNALQLSDTSPHVMSGSHIIKRKGIEYMEYVYTWTIMKPYLPQLEDFNSDRIYTAVYIPILDKSTHIEEHVTVSMGLLFTPCPVNACIHGLCYLKRGDVMTSMCLCQYPYAGERCESLSVSNEMYVIQIFSLVFSNLAMLPGVLFCMCEGLQIISAGLFTAATASAFYHLCDTDAYCIFGLSFQSLQVLDVLFCTAMMAIVLLLYAPISRHIHSALSVLVIGLLVSPVAYDPTNPINVIFALSFAVVVDIITWTMWIYRGELSLLGEGVRHGMNTIIFAKNRDTMTSPSSLQTTSYSSLSQNESMVDASTSTMDMALGVDDEELGEDGIALQTISTDVQTTFAPESNSSNPSCKSLTFGQILWYTRTGIFGGILGIVGLIFFANQSRENYWYTHSLWHIFVMLASYYLVKGRLLLFESMQIVDLFGRKKSNLTTSTTTNF